MGATVTFDEDLPSTGSGTGDVMYFINSRYLFLKVDVATDFVTTDFVKPTNQTARTAQILWMGNLVTNNARRLGVLFNVG